MPVDRSPPHLGLPKTLLRNIKANRPLPQRGEENLDSSLHDGFAAVGDGSEQANVRRQYALHEETRRVDFRLIEFLIATGSQFLLRDQCLPREYRMQEAAVGKLRKMIAILEKDPDLQSDLARAATHKQFDAWEQDVKARGDALKARLKDRAEQTELPTRPDGQISGKQLKAMVEQDKKDHPDHWPGAGK